ncbi:MAG: T9SS type A sorting domain-containing protein [Ignavibacteria bacterium]
MKKLNLLLAILVLICNLSIAQWNEQDYINSFNNPTCGTSEVSSSGMPVFPVDNDTLRVLVVYAKYPDDTWDPVAPGQATFYWPGNLGNQKPYWADQIIKPNTNNIGNSNITAYYRDASLGKFFVVGDVYPSLYIFNDSSKYYKPSNGKHIGWAVGELINSIKTDVDWLLYDKFAPNDPVNKRHPDGQIDCIMVIFRFLMGTEPSGTESGIASLGGHYQNFGPFGTSISLGQSKKFVSALNCFSNGSGLIAQVLTPFSYGVACHELGHYLIGTHRYNMGFFNLMNPNGNSFLCAEERQFLNWATPTNVSSSGTYIMTDYGTTGQSLIFQKGVYNYYLEYRRRINYHLSKDWTIWPYYNFQPLWPMSRDSGLFIYRETNRYDETPFPANGKWDWQKSAVYTNRYIVDSINNGLYLPIFFYDKPNRRNGKTIFNLVDELAVNYFTGEPFNKTKTHGSAGGDTNSCFDIGYNQVFSPWSNPAVNISYPSDSFAVEILGKTTDGNLIVNIDFENLTQTYPSKPQCLRIDKQFLSGSEAFNPKLIWYKNGEPDMMKYKLFRAQVISSGVDPINYSYIGETTDTFFVDNNIMLYRSGSGGGICTYIFRKYTYRVSAVDISTKESVRSERDSVWGYADPCAPAYMPNGQGLINNPSLKYELYQNYPNPFNPVTNIRFTIPENSFVELKIYNILGQEIKSLINEYKNAGAYIIAFDASNLPSGIYYYKINYKDVNVVKKMLLIK